MIPKIIHYCWFGGNPLDESALKCIDSWKKFFPDYDIKQWNEENFDIEKFDFVKKAYDSKKWAFVSDVVRLIVIYEMGGIYFDTDVEVVSNYDDILAESETGFFGFETLTTVNSGLGFGSIPNHQFLKELIEVYMTLDFEQYKDHLAEIACPILTTRLLKNKGLVMENIKQTCAGFVIYPSEYFSPIDYMSGKMVKTKRTHSIHWYSASWNSIEARKEHLKIQKYRRWFGSKCGEVLYGTINAIKKEGFLSYIIKRLKQLIKR